MTSKKICTIKGRPYLYERESYWDPVLKKSRQRNSRYIGPCDKDGNLLSAPKIRVDRVQSSIPVGALSMFYASARELNLTQHIASVLDVDRETASHIAGMALNQVVGHRSMRLLHEWIFQGPLMSWESLSPERVTAEGMWNALDSLCHREPDGAMMNRGVALQNEMTKAWRGNTREPAQYYYDVTKLVYNGECYYAEPGYFPGGTRKNVIGIGMVVSRTNHYPVLCRTIPGSYNDKVGVLDTVNSLKGFGFRHLTLIMDRGMVSRDNINHIVDAHYDVIGIVPETNKDAWKYITALPADTVEQPQNVIDRNSGRMVYAQSWSASLLGQKSVQVTLVVDPMRKVADQTARDSLLNDLSHVRDRDRLREIRRELGPLAVPARGRRGFRIDRDLAVEDRKGDGRFLMFSTDDNLSTEDMFNAYFQKDIVEKAFRTMKGDIALGPVRYRRSDHIDAHTTVVYLGYLLWSWTEKKLRKKFPKMTMNEAIRSVEKVALVRFGSGNKDREWLTNLTTHHEEVLKAVGATKYLPVA